LKRKVLLATAAACAIAAIPQARGALVRCAYAQAAAATPAPAVETSPPSGEVLAPAASTISAESPAAAAPAKAPSVRPRVKTASINRDSADNSSNANNSSNGDSRDSSSDSGSLFGGFEGKSNHGPINIKSDTMSFDYKKNVVVFTGKVHAVQSGSELTTDNLHVQMNKQSEIQEMIADGNVRMSQGTRWATGDHAVLDETVHTLLLTGSPVVHDGKDQIAGSKILVHLQTNISEVTDPKAVIFPRESKTPNNGEASAAAPGRAATPASAGVAE
jgi:lipopolysaccharide transport protein LptA